MDLCLTIKHYYYYYIGSSTLKGVQKVNSLWRVYVKDKVARLELTVKGQIAVNGRMVPLYDRNPYVTYQGLPMQKKMNNDKITIKNLPLSVSNAYVTIEQIWPHGHRAASFASNPAKIRR